MEAEEAVVLGMTVLILAGVAVLWMAMFNRRRIREMEHRERLAMIDRGLIPPPEVDPDGFERRAGLTPVESNAAVRSRSIGVIMVGLGFGLMALITFTGGGPEVGLGVGGSIALLGAAFIVNGALTMRTPSHPPRDDWRPRPPSRPGGSPEPPQGPTL